MSRISVLVVLESDGVQVPTPLTVDANQRVEDVKALLEAQCGISLADIELVFRGRPLENHETIDSCGVVDHDMIQATKRSASAAAAPSPTPQSMSLPSSIVGNPAALQQYLRSNPTLTQHLASNRAFNEALMNDDPNPLYNLLMSHLNQTGINERQAISNLNADPMSEEVQQALEEQIRRRNVQANMEAAIEHNPEAFIKVTMLFVPCRLNNGDIIAFVDSGAQSTIMSAKCAERCGISHLIDTRFQGMAKGVGSAKILGKVHYTEVKIGQHYTACSITVLDSDDMDFLLGLDMLKKHQMCIDLLKNCLRIGDDEISFLGAQELPSWATKMSEGAAKAEEEKSSADVAAPSPPSQAPLPLPNPPPPASHSSSLNESDILTLTGLGFSREASMRALAASGGNADLAAAFLFQQESL